jgi:imidazolonepropionase-like amidohydrolase
MRTSDLRTPAILLAALALAACAGPRGAAEQDDGTAASQDAGAATYVLVPDRIFDGFVMREGHAVAVSAGRIAAVGPIDTMPPWRRLALPGATVLPGFIDLHGHVAIQGVSFPAVLRHGSTTVRDLTGPAGPPDGGNGRLRRLSAGPIITAPHGYPLPVWGGASRGHGEAAGALAVEVADAGQARHAVDRHIDAGASLIKVALEAGGSPGAPWSMHAATVPPPWPLLSLEVVKAIVQQAHARGWKVSAHLSNAIGARLALDAGVDEWAHMPCEALPASMLARAAAAGVKIVGTLDTLSHCSGIFANTAGFVAAGGTLLYGTDMAHTELPCGIDARELELMMHASHGRLSAEGALSAATAKAGEQAGLAPLGQLVPGAPADLIAVKGNPLHSLKLLEYPELVVSGGRFVVDDLVRTSR